MSTIQQAFQEVGYKPSGLRLRTLRRMAEREQATQVEKIVDEVINPITKTRKIQLSKTGGSVLLSF